MKHLRVIWETKDRRFLTISALLFLIPGVLVIVLGLLTFWNIIGDYLRAVGIALVFVVALLLAFYGGVLLYGLYIQKPEDE